MLIAIDHGNKQMKTIHCTPFVSGLTESIMKPFGSDILEYQDKFYTLSNQRIPYKRNKTEDDRFFILTLFGIAEELRKKKDMGKKWCMCLWPWGFRPPTMGRRTSLLYGIFQAGAL